jgi:aspartate/methionine/tyrosine aminotransferase
VASDECYAELDWRPEGSGRATPSILDPEVCGDDHTGLLALYSLSKQSNLAGYRAGLVAGDPLLVQRILEVRKHAGMIMPTPVQHAMAVALRDDTHVQSQRAAYGRRRELLLPALARAALRVEESEAGLYLWATRDEDCWATVADLAERGILVAPGSFYGSAGARHVRIALTATDERVAAACARL